MSQGLGVGWGRGQKSLACPGLGHWYRMELVSSQIAKLTGRELERVSLYKAYRILLPYFSWCSFKFDSFERFFFKVHSLSAPAVLVQLRACLHYVYIIIYISTYNF